MHFNKNKILSAAAAVSISFVSLLNMPHKAQAISPSTPFPIAFQQDEYSGAEYQRLSYLPEYSNWCDYPWNRGTETGNTVGKAACSLFSTINNVYYHTGIMIDPTIVAQYALEKKYRRAGVEGVAVGYFSAFAKDFGSEYGMSFCGGTTSAEKVLAHVRSGGSTSTNIYGHWVTIADYDEVNDLYLILDSSQTNARCNNISWTDRENGVTWLPESILKATGAYRTYGINGRYSALYTFDYTFTAEMGDTDCNGIVDTADASIILERYASESAGMEPMPFHPHPTRNQLCSSVADINGDAVINIDDAAVILEKYALNASGALQQE